jgi:hypothetical protein
VITQAFKLELPPGEDQLFSYRDTGRRWGCHEKIAAKRIKELGIPVIKFNQRAHFVRLSDLLKIEKEAMS